MSFLTSSLTGCVHCKVGDPMDPTTEIGPSRQDKFWQGVHDQVQKSIAAGAKLLTGGNRIDGAGFFYEPTVLTAMCPRNRQLTARKSSVRSPLFFA